MNSMNYYGAPTGNFGFLGGPGSFRVVNGAGWMPLIEKLILDIADEEGREFALAQLSMLSKQNQELFHELGPLLWFSFGTMAVLVKEIISVYPLLSPPTLTLAQSVRVGNVLLLLQCVASHPDTRNVFLQSCIPMYLFPFIDTTCGEKQYEHLMCSSLEVIGRLVEFSDFQAINLLLHYGLIPKVMQAMDIGSESSKTMAIFIMVKIMLTDKGLNYLCSTKNRLDAVIQVLDNMVGEFDELPSFDRLKYVIACYLRLSQTENGLQILRYKLPRRLSDGTFHRYLCEDQSVLCWLYQLLRIVQSAQLQHQVL